MQRLEEGVIGHRGACAYAPENTLASFRKAHELGIQWVEFDVMLTRDGVPVVFHDDTLERTTNGRGDIYSFTYAELSKLDAGSWYGPEFQNERIPLLVDVVRYLTKSGMSANVEIKTTLRGNDKDTVRLALDAINTIISPDDPMFLFSSFSMEAMEYLSKLAPNSQRGLLLDEWRDDSLILARKIGCLSVNVNQNLMSPERVNLIKSAGFSLLCYTVNDAARAEELRSWGVDAVFSDAPDISRRSKPVHISYCRR